jgi:hypothetical protein
MVHYFGGRLTFHFCYPFTLNASFMMMIFYRFFIGCIKPFLYYKNNRHLYVDSVTGKRDATKIKSDIKKLFAVFTVTGVMRSTHEVSLGVCKIKITTLLFFILFNGLKNKSDVNSISHYLCQCLHAIPFDILFL